jgi:NADH dehydrogenase (ubiquinone) Fe-S protein 3
MKNIKTISNFFFLSNFSKFVLLFSVNVLFYNLIYFVQQNIPKFLFSIVLDKYTYIFSTTEKYLKFLFYFFKKHFQLQYRVLVDIAAVDLYTKQFRFQLNYIVLSMFFCTRLLVKVQVKNFQSVPSLVSLYNSSNWMEREVWDLFGIWIKNHSDLRRILTDYNFFGHPLRKDFPLTGFYELYYDEYYKSIITLRLSLQQHFRFYNYKLTWF